MIQIRNDIRFWINIQLVLVIIEHSPKVANMRIACYANNGAYVQNSIATIVDTV